MSKLFAILGDIHANLDALNVVLDDCRAQGVTDFLCTGDVVGYNACPHECMEEIYWLRNLPFTYTQMGVTLVHSTMDRPENFGYVFDNLQAEANFLRQLTPICFHGHTHCPMIYEKSMNGVFRIDAQDFTLPIGRKYFVNVGSVGQPRDGDPRASYVIYDQKARTIRYRRLEYDIEAAQERIRLAGLPERLATRLAVGQ